jgi:hypothetical protein
MTSEELDELINDIRCATFHMSDDEARPVINEFIKAVPELLDHHDIEWYYKYC